MREITYASAITEALRQCMAEDSRVVVWGEDVGKFGGVFQVTAGLMNEFGPKRVIDMPIAEAGFVGAGVGAALTGMRPVVEMMFIDFTTVCMDMIVNQMAKMHYMFGGRGKVPMVLRMNLGAGRGAAAQHSQSFHSFFAHIPGLRIVLPATPHDAKGLLISAIHDDNPVLFIEHKKLYTLKGDVPEEMYEVPIGKARVCREGTDVSVVATNIMVHKSLEVAEKLAGEGMSVEVIDLRSTSPLDREAVLASVRKTGRLVTADDGCRTMNIGAELACTVCEEALESLVAPVVRVASPDTPVPYSPPLETAYIPSDAMVEEAIRKVMRY